MYMNTTIDNNNYYAIISGFKLTDSRLVDVGIIGVIITFAILVLCRSGIDRNNSNYSSRSHISLKNWGRYCYILRVINQDNNLHMLYIDGLNLHTKY
jgi:hypothetical protein